MRHVGGMGEGLSCPHTPNLSFSKHLQDSCNLALEFATANKQVFGQCSLRMTIFPKNYRRSSFQNLGVLRSLFTNYTEALLKMPTDLSGVGCVNLDHYQNVDETCNLNILIFAPLIPHHEKTHVNKYK